MYLCHFLINVYFSHQNVHLMRERATLPGLAPYTGKVSSIEQALKTFTK